MTNESGPHWLLLSTEGGEDKERLTNNYGQARIKWSGGKKELWILLHNNALHVYFILKFYKMREKDQIVCMKRAELSFFSCCGPAALIC